MKSGKDKSNGNLKIEAECIDFLINFDGLTNDQHKSFFHKLVAYIENKLGIEEIDIAFDKLLNVDAVSIFNDKSKPKTYFLNGRLYFAEDILTREDCLIDDMLTIAYAIFAFAQHLKMQTAGKKSISRQTTMPSKKPTPAFYRDLVEMMGEKVDAEKVYGYSLATYITDQTGSESRKGANELIEKLVKKAITALNKQSKNLKGKEYEN